MSAFYGKLHGNRGQTTRCGSKSSGITAQLRSWKRVVDCHLGVDDDGNEVLTVKVSDISYPSRYTSQSVTRRIVLMPDMPDSF